MALYPGYPWNPAKFEEEAVRVKDGYWQIKDNLFKALARVEAKLDIQKVTALHVFCIVTNDSRFIARGLVHCDLGRLQRSGVTAQISKVQLAELLAEKYPDYKWEKVYLLKGRYAGQIQLERAVRSLFPVRYHRRWRCSLTSHFQHEEVIRNARRRKQASLIPKPTHISSWMCICRLYI